MHAADAHTHSTWSKGPHLHRRPPSPRGAADCVWLLSRAAPSMPPKAKARHSLSSLPSPRQSTRGVWSLSASATPSSFVVAILDPTPPGARRDAPHPCLPPSKTPPRSLSSTPFVQFCLLTIFRVHVRCRPRHLFLGRRVAPQLPASNVDAVARGPSALGGSRLRRGARLFPLLRGGGLGVTWGDAQRGTSQPLPLRSD